MNKSTVVYSSSGTALKREENKDEWQWKEGGRREASIKQCFHQQLAALKAGVWDYQEVIVK